MAVTTANKCFVFLLPDSYSCLCLTPCTSGFISILELNINVPTRVPPRTFKELFFHNNRGKTIILLFICCRLIYSPSTAQGHLGAFHKFQSYTGHTISNLHSNSNSKTLLSIKHYIKWKCNIHVYNIHKKNI